MERLSKLFSRSTLISTATVRGEIPPSSIANDGISLLDLPLEIILAIESYLPYENAVAFSLTCKHAYDSIFNQRKPAPKHHGHEARLLRLIERDLPGYLSCPIHERLYTWAPLKSKHYHCPLCISSKRTAWSGSLVICNKSCKSSFYGIFEPERRLILRHSLLGPEYGLSPQLLSHLCKNSHSKLANEVTPKIVNGSLMLRRIHHVSTRIDFKSPDDEPAFINTFNEAICLHTEIYLRPLVYAAIQHAKQQRDATQTTSVNTSASTKSKPKHHRPPNHPKHWTCPILFKCHMCATDIRMHITSSTPQHLTIRFTAYQDLGDLHDLSIAQRQIFGVRHEGRHVVLKGHLKHARLVENLEAQYHHQNDNNHTADNDPLNQQLANCADVLTPRYTALLRSWVYDHRKMSEDRVKYLVDDMVPKEFQDEYNCIPFELQENGLMDPK